jgi:outer membrane protein TolC
MAAAAALLTLAGCASFSTDGGFGTVAELTRERTGRTPAWHRSDAESEAARDRVRQLLAQPLTADAAVDIALLNNRGLQARYAELGIAEADFVRAGRLPNPTFGITRVAGGGVTEIDRSILVDVLGVLTMPLAAELGKRRLDEARWQAAAEAVGLAHETRRSFYAAVAAHDLLTYFEQVQDAAEASAELARRMLQAGNFTKLAQMRQQSFRADATARLARARQQALVERERLVRLLGLSGDQLDFRLIERLPDLPAAPAAPQDVEQTAIDRRLDVQLAKGQAQATARALGLTRATRFVNVLEAGAADQNTTGEPRRRGYEIRLELPLFDFGTTRAARAETLYRQSLDRTTDIAVRARSEVRERDAAHRTAYDLARHYRDEVVPLQKRISDENLLRYNGMLLGVFELLADAREQVASVAGYVEALRDYWMAESDLQAALSGGTASDMAPQAVTSSRSGSGAVDTVRSGAGH